MRPRIAPAMWGATLLVVLLLLSVTPGLTVQKDCEGPPKGHEVICYTEGWADADDLQTCSCSHLVLPGLKLDDDFGIVDGSATYEGIRRPGLKKIISLGADLSSNRLAQLVTSSGGLDNLAESVKQKLRDADVDGVEVNADSVSSRKDVKNLQTVLQALRSSSLASEQQLLVRLPAAGRQLASLGDLSGISQLVDRLVLAADRLTSRDRSRTRQLSRLMGDGSLDSVDALLDLLLSRGVEAGRLVITLPSYGYLYELADPGQTSPGSRPDSGPVRLARREVCGMFNSSWAEDRDDDMTSPYAHYKNSWITYEDEISTAVKTHYMLLRALPGLAVDSLDADADCGHGQLADTVDWWLRSLADLSRRDVQRRLQLLMNVVEQDVTPEEAKFRSPAWRLQRAGGGDVRAGGSVSKCADAGYFRRREVCGEYERCVRWPGATNGLRFFYECPSGMLFDDRWEICTWASATEPCENSNTEVPPVEHHDVPCEADGYFADPSNCKYFQLCRDYYNNGTFTKFEFKCPYGLGYDDVELTCTWAWLVPRCGASSTMKTPFSQDELTTMASGLRSSSAAVDEDKLQRFSAELSEFERQHDKPDSPAGRSDMQDKQDERGFLDIVIGSVRSLFASAWSRLTGDSDALESATPPTTRTLAESALEAPLSRVRRSPQWSYLPPSRDFGTEVSKPPAQTDVFQLPPPPPPKQDADELDPTRLRPPRPGPGDSGVGESPAPKTGLGEVTGDGEQTGTRVQTGESGTGKEQEPPEGAAPGSRVPIQTTPGKPTKPEYPGAPGPSRPGPQVSQAPSGAGTPGRPGKPGTTGQQETPGTPGQPGTLGSGGSVGTPGRPGAPGRPGTPGTQGRPTTGSGPATKGPSGAPRRPGTEVGPGTGGRPGTPGEPGTGGTPGTQGTPGIGGRPGTGGIGIQGTPQTGGRPGTEGTPGVPGKPGTQERPGTARRPGTGGTGGTQGRPGTGGRPGEGGLGPDSGFPEGSRGPGGSSPAYPTGFPGPQGRPGSRRPGTPGEPGIPGKPGTGGTPGAGGIGTQGRPGTAGTP
ncbi:uncharacterized protein LOC119113905, partial [Pollicipes pollicipes]|uniref:uncharacterized protein LOC119113905 n=1 Tax=Pollicipes pollicipes TaxID=41117 RepID=UPI001885525F